MHLNLPTRVSINIFLILTLAVSLTGLMNHYKYRKYLSDLLRDRHALVLQDIGHSIESSLSLGLAVDSLPGVNSTLQARTLREPGVLSIEMFDEHGTVLYSSDESLNGDLVSKEWAAAWKLADLPVWARVEHDAHVVGVRVNDVLGHAVGSLALRYSRAAFDREVRAMALRIAGLCAATVLLVSFCGTVVTVILTRGLRTRLQRMRLTLEDSARDPHVESERSAAHLTGVAGSAHQAIAAATREIRQIEAEPHVAPAAAKPRQVSAAPVAPTPAAADTETAAGPDERRQYRGVILRLAALTAVLLMLAQGVVSYVLATTFENSLLPEIRHKAEVAGELATDQISYALSLGIPLHALVGMDQFLQGVLARNPDFTHLAVSTADGEELYTQGTPASSSRDADSLELPIRAAGGTAGLLHVEVREGAVRSELAGLRLDIATAFLVTLLIGIELLVAFVLVRISGPIRLTDRLIGLSAKGDFLFRIGLRDRDEIGHVAQAYNNLVHRVNTAFAMLAEEADDARAVQIDRTIQQRIRDVITKLGERFRFTSPGLEETVVPRSPMDVRIPLFLFMVAQELSRPFLPLYFSEVYTPIGNLSRELTIGLPITTFMAMVLVATPVAGAISDRIGPRTLFVLGIVPSVAGHVGAALAATIVESLLWWTLAGLGYGTIFISAQTYVAHHAEASRRAVGMSGFTGAVFAAFVCGPAMGGILADRLGYRNTLLVAAAMAVFAAAAALIAVDRDSPTIRPRRQALTRSWRRVFRHREFVMLTLFSAVPNKLVLSGLFFYLLPLFLADLGNTQSNIGRVLMVFGIACIAITPLAASGSDRFGSRAFIILGGLMSGLGCLLPTVANSTGGVLAAAAILGSGQALTTAPQLAVIQRIAENGRSLGSGPGAIVGAFRTIERIGTAAGALAVGAVVSFVGYGEAMLIVGALVIACTFCFTLFSVRSTDQGVPA